MANSQTYLEGFGQTEVTTLSNVQGAGLTLPAPTGNFINTRAPGKLEILFNNGNNSNVLYTTNKPTNLYLKGPLAERLDYIDINTGLNNSTIRTQFQSSVNDGRFVTRFLGTNQGRRFILNQLLLQGFQPFDETKIYNPASPIIAAFRLATFGLADYPNRQLDTSNIVGGLIGAAGLGSIARTVSGLFGGGPPVPSPPRSSVASEASRGFGLATFTSFLGGGDRSDLVVAPLARPDVKGLLRGQTATNAYNATRYSKLVNNAGGGFFSRLLSAAGKFIQNNTLVGGIIPPKQPWAANYRADEQTYDLYLNAGKLFEPTNTGIGGGGILSGLLNGLGFGKKANYSLAVTQRFYNSSINAPNFNRSINISKLYGYSTKYSTTTEIGVKTIDRTSNITTEQITGGQSGLKYSDLVGVKDNGNLEKSDQLLNYDALIKQPKNFSDTFTDPQSQTTKNIASDLSKALNNILGVGLENYSKNDSITNITPSQFNKLNLLSQEFTDDQIGFNYIKSLRVDSQDGKYLNRFKDNTGQPTRNGKSDTERFIEPTNKKDYVNSLNVLTTDEFKKSYSQIQQKKFGGIYGPDIVKFYFYDIVNEKYIPFSATVKNIQDSNIAEWEQIDYLGRPDKQWYYKGFTRDVNFNFTVNAHSIKELLPMWQRINYLVGLTRPANYTLTNAGGFMVPPMIQLTLGDFYKNHFVIIKSCNVSIPEDASWETLSEDIKENWYWGPNKSFELKDSIGLYAQFPRTADISIQMNVLEKDRPKTGRAIWGDASVSQTAEQKDSYVDKIQRKDFSINLRYDNESNYIDDVNTTANNNIV